MNKITRTLALLFATFILILPTLAQDDVVLVPFTNDMFGIEGLIPEGWAEAAPGVNARQSAPTDLSLIVQQAALGVTADDVAQSVLPSLGISELPEPVEIRTTDAFEWSVYYVAVESPLGNVNVDIALAETTDGAYLILMQAGDDDYETLHADVFLPVVDAFAILGTDDEMEESVDDATYTDPDGFFSAPIPANWTATQNEGWVRFEAPEGELIIDVLSFETSGDLEADIAEGWALTTPDFEYEYIESNAAFIDDATVLEGLDAVQVINYTTDDDRIVQGVARLFDGRTYLFLVDGDLVTVQQRSAQINILDSGFEITAMASDDLSGTDPIAYDDTMFAELSEYIETALVSYDTPGVALAIVQDGEVIFSDAFGVKDLDTGEELTTDTLMMIGSTTKSMTAFMMAQLVEEGSLDWNQPVVEIMPEFAFADAEITEEILVKHLMCACTGVPRRDFELIFENDGLTAEGVVESLATFEVFTDFGEAFQYSNQMVATGGFIAAIADGGAYGNLFDDYASSMQTRLFDPLGMSRTTFYLDEAITDGNLSTPHAQRIDGTVFAQDYEAERSLEIFSASGGIWSNVDEMSQYLITITQNGVAPSGEALIQPESLQALWEAQVPLSADASYGLGWFIEDYKGVPVRSHAGTTLGFQSEFFVLPESGFGMVILSNRNGSAVPSAIRGYVLEQLFDQEHETEALIQFALEQGEEDLAELNENISDTQEGMDAFVGIYTSDVLGDVEIYINDDGLLVLDAGEFASILKLFTNPDTEESNWGMFEPPLAGVGVDFEDDANSFTIGAGVVEYEFVRTNSE